MPVAMLGDSRFRVDEVGGKVVKCDDGGVRGLAKNAIHELGGVGVGKVGRSYSYSYLKQIILKPVDVGVGLVDL